MLIVHFDSIFHFLVEVRVELVVLILISVQFVLFSLDIPEMSFLLCFLLVLLNLLHVFMVLNRIGQPHSVLLQVSHSLLCCVPLVSEHLFVAPSLNLVVTQLLVFLLGLGMIHLLIVMVSQEVLKILVLLLRLVSHGLCILGILSHLGLLFLSLHSLNVFSVLLVSHLVFEGIPVVHLLLFGFFLPSDLVSPLYFSLMRN